MGQNLTRQKLQNNLKNYFPDMSQYQAYQQNSVQDEPVFIWQNKIKKQSLIEYQYWLKNETQYSNLLNAFVFRYNNQSLLSTKFIIVQFRGLQYFVRVFYQRSISNLSYFKEIPYSDMGYFMLQSLKGFFELKRRFGCFHVQDDMFHITDKKQVKIWIKEKVYDNSPNLKVCLQVQMIEQILNTIEKNTSFNLLNSQKYKCHQTPLLISSQLKKRISILNSFQLTIKALSQIIDQQVYDIGQSNQNSMKCLDQLQYHELINIMQQAKNKIKSRSSSPIKQSILYYQLNENKSKQNYQNLSSNKVNYTQQQRKFYSQQSFYRSRAQNQNDYNRTQNSFNKNSRSKSGKRSGISLTKNHRSSSVQIKNQAMNSNPNIQSKVNFNINPNQSFTNQNSNIFVISLGKNKSEKSFSYANCKRQNVVVPPTPRQTFNKPPLHNIPTILNNSPHSKNSNSISKVSVKYLNNQNFYKSKQNKQNTVQNQQQNHKKLTRYATCSGDLSFTPFKNISNNNINHPSALNHYNISNPILKVQNTQNCQNVSYQKSKPFFFQVNNSKNRSNNLCINKTQTENTAKMNNFNDNQYKKDASIRQEFQIPKIFIHEPRLPSQSQQKTNLNYVSSKIKNYHTNEGISKQQQFISNFKKQIISPSTAINYSSPSNERYAVSRPLFNFNKSSQQNLYTDPQLYEYLTNKSLPYSQPNQTKQINQRRNTCDNFYTVNKNTEINQYKNKQQPKIIQNNKHHPLEDINISQSINFTQTQMENINAPINNQKNIQYFKERQRERKFDLYFPTITQIQEINESGRTQNNQSFLPIKNVSSRKLSTRRRGTEESVVVQYKRFYQQSESNTNRGAISPIKQTFKQNNDKVITQKQVSKRFVSYQPTIDPMVLQDLNRMKLRQVFLIQ